MAAMTRRLSLSEGARPSLAKMLATCFSTTPGEMTSASAMATLDRPWAMSESTSRSRGVSAARESARRLAGDAADGLEEVAHVGDAVLQQVADARRGTGEQLGCGAGLDVLGEHEHADLRVVVMDRQGGAQPLVGVGRRHAHVDDGHVGQVRGDGVPERLRVGDRGDHVKAPAGEGLGQPVPHDRGVLGYDDAER
jgi:hypothetical protein